SELNGFQYFLRGMETFVAKPRYPLECSFQYFLRGMETKAIYQALGTLGYRFNTSLEVWKQKQFIKHSERSDIVSILP
ncbi:hypothetical protein Mc24_04033, partial [Thermotoga sp. Mc24]